VAVRVALVWVASYFVPAGAYDIDPKAGGPVPGSYHEIPSCANAQRNESRVETAFDQRLGQLWSAPPTRSGETLSFFVLLVPLTLALGYDRMVTASIIFVGAGTGVLRSTVNPFARASPPMRLASGSATVCGS